MARVGWSGFCTCQVWNVASSDPVDALSQKQRETLTKFNSRPPQRLVCALGQRRRGPV
jgi:hypothetical protein